MCLPDRCQVSRQFSSIIAYSARAYNAARKADVVPCGAGEIVGCSAMKRGLEETFVLQSSLPTRFSLHGCQSTTLIRLGVGLERLRVAETAITPCHVVSLTSEGSSRRRDSIVIRVV